MSAARQVPPSSTLTWGDGDRFVLDETTFQAMPPDALAEGTHLELGEGVFFIFKPRSLVERHVVLVDELQPQHIFELGFFSGGSTLFLAQLARPQRLVAIDRQLPSLAMSRVESCAARRGLVNVVRTFGKVNQADRKRLAQIAEEEFAGAALDLVVDDCSHLYEATRASFNELFPRLRPGGAYVIEDWRWAHTPLGEKPLEGWFPDQVPLTRLLFEIVLALPGMPGLIREISIEKELALVRRGDAEIDPGSFDISSCSNPRGQALLAPS
jgi:SAM-dependent methyltransferase